MQWQHLANCKPHKQEQKAGTWVKSSRSELAFWWFSWHRFCVHPCCSESLIALTDISLWENELLPTWNVNQSKQGCNVVLHQGVTPPGCGASITLSISLHVWVSERVWVKDERNGRSSIRCKFFLATVVPDNEIRQKQYFFYLWSSDVLAGGKCRGDVLQNL